MSENDTSDLDAPIWGAEAIGRVINRNPRQTYNLLHKNQLPAKKVGNLHVSTKRQLLAAITVETS